MNNFTGVIIKESLKDTSILKDLNITSTEIEPVTEGHKTPWVSQWTMHTVDIPSKEAGNIAERIRLSLDAEHHWYADFKNDTEHYIIYRDKVFHITDRTDKNQYDAATEHGIALGIPAYQVDFSPHVTHWDR